MQKSATLAGQLICYRDHQQTSSGCLVLAIDETAKLCNNRVVLCLDQKCVSILRVIQNGDTLPLGVNTQNGVGALGLSHCLIIKAGCCQYSGCSVRGRDAATITSNAFIRLIKFVFVRNVLVSALCVCYFGGNSKTIYPFRITTSEVSLSKAAGVYEVNSYL